MKIALCSDWVYPSIGGVQSHITGLAGWLSEMGHEVVIVSKEMNQTNIEPPAYDSNIREIKTRKLSPIEHAIVPPNPSDLRKVFRNERFDVIHAHHAFTPTALLSLSVAKELGIPSVLTNHSISVASSSDTLWSSMSHILFPLRKYINEADRVIAVSEAAAEFISRFLERKEICVIPNGVDVSKFSQEEYPDPGLISQDTGDYPKIFSVGRLSFRKGFHLLIEAMPNILKERPDTRLFIAGKGYMMPFLKGLSNSFGLNDNVSYLGYVSDEALPWLYRNCDVFAFPSITSESFGITLIEAMAAGSPVVASRIGGVPEIVDDGVNGCLFNPWNSRELSEKISSLLNNPSIARDLGVTARKTAVERYSWSVVGSKIVNIYEELVY